MGGQAGGGLRDLCRQLSQAIESLAQIGRESGSLAGTRGLHLLQRLLYRGSHFVPGDFVAPDGTGTRALQEGGYRGQVNGLGQSQPATQGLENLVSLANHRENRSRHQARRCLPLES